MDNNAIARGLAGTPLVVTYQYQIYLPRSEVYAIRLAGLEVTGVYGPLEYREVLFSLLPDFCYEEQCADLVWVKSSLSDFVPCENEYEEFAIWI